MDMLYNCCTMHNNTHSVHNVMEQSSLSSVISLHLPSLLSGLNWCSLSPLGGLGPPTPKVASPFPGSVQTPSPWFRTSTVSRSSEGIEAAQRRAASLHLGHAAAGSGRQQSEHILFNLLFDVNSHPISLYILYILCYCVLNMIFLSGK